MKNYSIVLTSLNELSFLDIMEYITDDLKLSDELVNFFKEMLLNDLARENMYHSLTNDDYFNKLATPENVQSTNEILHSYFVNKLFPYATRENDIDVEYMPIVDPDDIVNSYFKAETGGKIYMAFQVCFGTKEAFRRFKLKYPKEKDKLNFFNQTTY